MLSPKQIGTICFAFSLILISQKSFSENLSDNPTCDNSTLGVYSGSVALEPDWGANTIPLRWYNNNTLMDVTNAESSCLYDGSIDVATAPSRTGYNFSGWTVRPERSFDTLKTATYITGQEVWGKGEFSYSHGDVCYIGGDVRVSCDSDSNFFELQQHEWKSETTKGMIYGTAYCSGKNGNTHNGNWGGDSSDWKATRTELIDAEGSKQRCWCLVTGWVPDGEQTMYAPDASLPWVFRFAFSNLSDCSAYCAVSCTNFRNNSGFRAALLSPVTTTNNQ